MGTHAMVGVWNAETNEVTASYVHYDGYLEGVGKTLTSFYNNNIMAKIVAKGGYLSSLEDYYEHSRAKSVHSDPAVCFDSIQDYLANGSDYAGAEYLYLWDGEAWFYSEHYGETKFEEVELNLSVM